MEALLTKTAFELYPHSLSFYIKVQRLTISLNLADFAYRFESNFANQAS